MDAPHADNPWAPPPAGPPQHLVPPQPTAHHVAWPQQAPYAYPVAAPAYAQPAAPWWQHPAYWERPSRRHSKRVAMFAGFVAAWAAIGFGVLVGIIAVVAMGLNPGAFPTDDAYNAALDARIDDNWATSMWTWVAIMVVAQLVVFAALTRKVAYRWFDTFTLLVPVYGFFFAGKILWRCTDLAQFRTAAPNPWGPPPEPVPYGPPRT